MSTAEQKMSRALAVMLGSLAVFVIAMVVILVLSIKAAFARDLGQWENSDPAVRQWYRSLMMPDFPDISCCGEGDAYWCDKVNVRNGKTFCTITDDRDDAPLRRRHIPIGTEYEIPNHKLTFKDGNPTGHVILFVNANDQVLCFVQGTGA